MSLSLCINKEIREIISQFRGKQNVATSGEWDFKLTCLGTRERRSGRGAVRRKRTDERGTEGRGWRARGVPGGWGRRKIRRCGEEREWKGSGGEWMSVNWRPQLPFQLWPSRTPTPVKINVSRCGLATNRSDNVAPPPHPPALAAHLKIHVHLCAESKVPTKRDCPACDGQTSSLTDFHALPTPCARDAAASASRGRDISRKRFKKN